MTRTLLSDAVASSRSSQLPPPARGAERKKNALASNTRISSPLSGRTCSRTILSRRSIALRTRDASSTSLRSARRASSIRSATSSSFRTGMYGPAEIARLPSRGWLSKTPPSEEATENRCSSARRRRTSQLLSCSKNLRLRDSRVAAHFFGSPVSCALSSYAGCHNETARLSFSVVRSTWKPCTVRSSVIARSASSRESSSSSLSLNSRWKSALSCKHLVGR